MAFVELQAIVKRFGGVCALDGVDLACATGRVHALLGENGAGKSTLIKVLTGAVQPDTGEIIVDGAETAFAEPASASAAGIAAVYQEPLVYPHLSVLENLFMGQEPRDRLGRTNRRRMRELAEPVLTRLEVDTRLLDKTMATLPIGYQQMMLIAQALLAEARLIIFDEPTSILSRDETRRLFVVIDNLRAADTAVVYITHRLEEIEQIADDVTVLRNGQVAGSGAVGDFSQARLLAMMAGRDASTSGADQARADYVADAAGPARLEVRGLSVAGYSQDVDWTLSAGCVTGIYGLVGSGRSETAMAAFGHLPRAAGTIYLDGADIAPRHPRDAVERGLAYLPEDRQVQGLFLDKTLENNLTSNAVGEHTGWLGRLDLAGLRRLAEQIMARYAIKAPNAATPIGWLSGGNQQKALFARWAQMDLNVLILDEPTRGIDVGTKAEIHNFVRELAAGGAAVGVISSDLDEVLSISDELIVMRQGEVVDRFSGTSIQAEPILAAAIGGERAEPPVAEAAT